MDEDFTDNGRRYAADNPRLPNVQLPEQHGGGFIGHLTPTPETISLVREFSNDLDSSVLADTDDNGRPVSASGESYVQQIAEPFHGIYTDQFMFPLGPGASSPLASNTISVFTSYLGEPTATTISNEASSVVDKAGSHGPTSAVSLHGWPSYRPLPAAYPQSAPDASEHDRHIAPVSVAGLDTYTQPEASTLSSFGSSYHLGDPYFFANAGSHEFSVPNGDPGPAASLSGTGYDYAAGPMALGPDLTVFANGGNVAEAMCQDLRFRDGRTGSNAAARGDPGPSRHGSYPRESHFEGQFARNLAPYDLQGLTSHDVPPSVVPHNLGQPFYSQGAQGIQSTSTGFDSAPQQYQPDPYHRTFPSDRVLMLRDPPQPSFSETYLDYFAPPHQPPARATAGHSSGSRRESQRGSGRDRHPYAQRFSTTPTNQAHGEGSLALPMALPVDLRPIAQGSEHPGLTQRIDNHHLLVHPRREDHGDPVPPRPLRKPGQGGRSGPLHSKTVEDVNHKKWFRTVCTRCKYTKLTCDRMRLGQECSACRKSLHLCAEPYLIDLVKESSNLPVLVLNYIPGYSQQIEPDNAVNLLEIIRTLEKIRGNDVVVDWGGRTHTLDLEELCNRLERIVEKSRSPSELTIESVSRNILYAGGWSACVETTGAAGEFDGTKILARLFCGDFQVRYRLEKTPDLGSGPSATRILFNPHELQDWKCIDAIHRVFHLLARSLELEVVEGMNKDLNEHKEMNKKEARATGRPANVLAKAIPLLTLLLALKKHFASLTRGDIKWRVGELCRRLFTYYFCLRERKPTLSDDDIEKLPGILDVESHEMPSRGSQDDFHRWMDVSSEDVLVWKSFVPGR